MSHVNAYSGPRTEDFTQTMSTLLKIIQGISVFQDDDKRIHYIADMDVDVDGAKHAYRLDNRRPPALDDIHASAGYPDGSWHNVLAADPRDHTKPYVDPEGFCVSMTSYWREDFEMYDRQRWVDAEIVPYIVLPGSIRKMARGVCLGCRARITRTTDGKFIDGVYADTSGGTIGEVSVNAAKVFGSQWNANNGDSREIYQYQFWPDEPALVNGEQFRLIPYSA